MIGHQKQPHQFSYHECSDSNWSYNPVNYENNEVPVSVMAQDLLTTYKYGWKTSYYQNTHDMKTDDVVSDDQSKLDNLLAELDNADEAECESCAI